LKGFGDILGGSSIFLGVVIAVVLIVEVNTKYFTLAKQV
jgi:hypothetical protein